MKYYSTRDEGRKTPCTLKQAAFMGLAPDGGLFMPEYIPQADLSEVERLADISYADMAIYLASLFFGDDVPADRLEAMVRRAYDFDCPLRSLGLARGVEAATPKVRGIEASAPLTHGVEAAAPQVLELFHGPTFAFKDFGARFMGGMLGLLSDRSDALTVLTATSGDTGSAVAAGFHNVPGISVVVLYPEGKVSPLQESQMTTLGNNIHPVRVRGSFDDCQALVKSVFNDSEFRAHRYVTSANSINVLRWIPQSFYYFYAWAQWKKARKSGEAPDIVVPSGNYGNITAGMLASKMGLPVRRFVCGSNANDVVPEFLSTGEYRPRPSVRTVANAMDVGAPSNYERMMCLYGNDFDSLKSSLSGYAYSDGQIISAIADIYSRYGYISDPHAAVGYLAYVDSAADGFYLATAHAAKFAEVIAKSLPGVELSIPEGLAAAMKRPKTFTPMDNDVKSLESFIDSLFQ